MSSIIKVQNIQYTDGDAALTIADGGGVTLSDDLSLADNKKIKLGTGNDLEIYHNGSESYIADVGTGGVKFRASTIRWEKNDGSETLGGVDADGGWFLKANNSTALNIDTVGAVTKPLQPSISVQGDGTSAHTFTSDHTITEFTTSGTNFYNQGITFNNSDGKFTVPTTGRYLINVCIYLYSNSVFQRLRTFVNGTEVLHWSFDNTTGDGDLGQDNTIQGSCILTLAASDYIQFGLYHGGVTKGYGMWNAHSHASMHLLS